jgi:hypothetical protein
MSAWPCASPLLLAAADDALLIPALIMTSSMPLPNSSLKSLSEAMAARTFAKQQLKKGCESLGWKKL